MVSYCSFLGFLALVTYIFTLIPSNIGKVFQQTKKWKINRFLLKNRRNLGLMAFSLSVSHTLNAVNKYDINLLHLDTYRTYYTGISTLVIFTILALTSNNWSIRKLKHKWKTLHKLTYLAMFLLIWHIFSLMKDSWSYLTPVELSFIISISVIFLIRLVITNKKDKIFKNARTH